MMTLPPAFLLLLMCACVYCTTATDDKAELRLLVRVLKSLKQEEHKKTEVERGRDEKEVFLDYLARRVQEERGQLRQTKKAVAAACAGSPCMNDGRCSACSGVDCPDIAVKRGYRCLCKWGDGGIDCQFPNACQERARSNSPCPSERPYCQPWYYGPIAGKPELYTEVKDKGAYCWGTSVRRMINTMV